MPTVIEPVRRTTIVVVKVDDADAISGAYFRRPILPTRLEITYLQNAAEPDPFAVHVRARGRELRRDGTIGARAVEHLVTSDELTPWMVAAVRRHTPPPFAPDAVVTRAM